MRDTLTELERWWAAGEPVGMATVVATWRSAPRPPGATMLVGPDGTAVGSVSGGCVEGAVYELAREVTETGVPVLQRYGVSDSDAFAVGLTCGGILDVYVERVDRTGFPALGAVASAIRPRAWAGASSCGPTGPRARSARTGWTRPPPMTHAACSPPGVPAPCTTGTR